jgi:hypothetical protein
MRSTSNDCYKCEYAKLCYLRKDLNKLLEEFTKGLTFTMISTEDKPQDEFRRLLARWCFYYKEDK